MRQPLLSTPGWLDIRDVEVGLVERKRFDNRRVLGEDTADLLADRLLEPRGSRRRGQDTGALQ